MSGPQGPAKEHPFCSLSSTRYSPCNNDLSGRNPPDGQQILGTSERLIQFEIAILAAGSDCCTERIEAAAQHCAIVACQHSTAQDVFMHQAREVWP
eukprot:2455468-Rhodomonas_salina.1